MGSLLWCLIRFDRDLLFANGLAIMVGHYWQFWTKYSHYCPNQNQLSVKSAICTHNCHILNHIVLPSHKTNYPAQSSYTNQLYYFHGFRDITFGYVINSSFFLQYLTLWHLEAQHKSIEIHMSVHVVLWNAIVPGQEERGMILALLAMLQGYAILTFWILHLNTTRTKVSLLCSSTNTTGFHVDYWQNNFLKFSVAESRISQKRGYQPQTWGGVNLLF